MSGARDFEAEVDLLKRTLADVIADKGALADRIEWAIDLLECADVQPQEDAERGTFEELILGAVEEIRRLRDLTWKVR